MISQEDAHELVLEAFSRLGMTQSGIEAREFARLVCDHGASNLLELGTGAGGMMYLLDKVCREGLRISIDRPWPDRDPKLPDEWERLFKKRLPNVLELWGDIHSEDMKTLLEKHLGEDRFDLIFADADHSYWGAKKHFAMYSPLLRKGGLFAFHDIANGHPCQKFWEVEIVPNFKTWIFTEPENLYGIGVIQIPCK